MPKFFRAVAKTVSSIFIGLGSFCLAHSGCAVAFAFAGTASSSLGAFMHGAWMAYGGIPLLSIGTFHMLRYGIKKTTGFDCCPNWTLGLNQYWSKHMTLFMWRRRALQTMPYAVIATSAVGVQYMMQPPPVKQVDWSRSSVVAYRSGDFTSIPKLNPVLLLEMNDQGQVRYFPLLSRSDHLLSMVCNVTVDLPVTNRDRLQFSTRPLSDQEVQASLNGWKQNGNSHDLIQQIQVPDRKIDEALEQDFLAQLQRSQIRVK